MSTTFTIIGLVILALAGALTACHFAVKAMRHGFAARRAEMTKDPLVPWDG